MTSRRAVVFAACLALVLELFCSPTNLYLGPIAAYRGAIGTLLLLALVVTARSPWRFATEGRGWTAVETFVRVAPAVALHFALAEARDWSVSTAMWTVLSAALCVLLVAVGFTRSLVLALVVYGVAGVFVRALQIGANPGLAKYGDMLPLVDAALEKLRAGSSPYATYAFSSGDVPLTYLPVTWLAYAPCRLLGLDLRWTNVLAHVATMAALVHHARRGGGAVTFHVVRLAAWLFVSASFVAWDLGATAPIFWAVLAWTIAACVRDDRAAPLWLGVCLATSPLALPLAVPLAFVWPRRRLGLALVVAAVICAPFFLWSPRAFVEGVVLWFNVRFPPIWWSVVSRWQQIPGFATWAWRLGIPWLLKPLQLAVVIAFAAWVTRAKSPLARFGAYAAPCFLAFMLLNPVLWSYFYEPAWIAALVAATLATDRS